VAGPRAILYDLDGVLIDSARAWHRALLRGLAEAGRPPVPWDRFQPSFGQGVEADRDAYFPGWTVAELEACYARCFPAELDAIELNPGAAELLAELRARGLRQAVVTNTPRALALEVLAHKGLAPHLDALAAAGEAAEKPAPELIWLALERLAIPREQALYVGDSATDLAAARAAGIRMAGLGIEADLTLVALADLRDLL
jgi:HAD superfamily hydrolase (TIGR01509 family)